MINGIPFLNNLGNKEEEEKKKIDRLSKKKREIKEPIKKVNEYKFK